MTEQQNGLVQSLQEKFSLSLRQGQYIAYPTSVEKV